MFSIFQNFAKNDHARAILNLEYSRSVKAGPSSVHTWIKVFAKYLNNRNRLIKHVIEKHGEKTKIKEIKNSHPPTARFYLFPSTNKLDLLANKSLTSH
jgi:hypothetical protein